MTTRRGMTLIELVVSLGLLAILSLAMGSLMTVAARAFPQAASASDTSRLSRALELLTADLAPAVAVIHRTATSIEVSVPDRTGDSIDDTIQYSWGGTAGDPLTRAINAGTPEVIASGIAGFQLDVVGVTRVTSELVESVESPLISSAGSRAGSTGTSALIWGGQYARPSIPVQALSWNITAVEFVCASSGKVEGVGAVRIRPANGLGLPTGTVLGEAKYDEATLSAIYTSQKFRVPVRGLAPGDGVCICVEWVSGVNPGPVAFATLAPRADSFAIATLAGSLGWSASPVYHMIYTLYGTVITEQTTSTTTLERINVALTDSDPTLAPARASVRLLNSPEE